MRERQTLYKHFLKVLEDEQAHRKERPYDGPQGWVQKEREAMRQAVDYHRMMRGRPAVLLSELMAVERMATGHVDYSTKFAWYCTDLALKP